LRTELRTAKHLVKGTIGGNIAKLDRREGFAIHDLA
jgi:predicted acetyltransferase